MNAPSSPRPIGLIITGESGTGKSRTMEQFCKEHKPEPNPDSEYAEHPAICILGPHRPNPRAVYKSILQELGHPLLYNPNEDDLRQHTISMIRGCKVGTIMIDEIYDIAQERMSNQIIDFLQFLKTLINATRRPFVIAGTPPLLDLIRPDEQLAGRLTAIVRLHPFGLKDFLKILLAFEKVMPLRRPSNLRKNEDALQLLYTLSQGYIGRLSNMLFQACQIAVDSGEERITIDILQKVADRNIFTAGQTTS